MFRHDGLTLAENVMDELVFRFGGRPLDEKKERPGDSVFSAHGIFVRGLNPLGT